MNLVDLYWRIALGRALIYWALNGLAGAETPSRPPRSLARTRKMQKPNQGSEKKR
jgi:hypothetical protein